MRTALTSCLLLAGLAIPAPAPGDVPGVWLLDDSDGTDQRRLVVGGAGQKPPAPEDEICLGWSWRDPKPGVDLYPDAEGGTFLEILAVGSATADGETAAGQACGTAEAPFPHLGLGPGNEVWLLAPEAHREDDPPVARQPPPAAWADLLHAVEAAYRQATPPSLGARTIGELGGCDLRSLPVALGTQLDRWSPLELPAGRASGAAPEDGADDASGRGVVRARRFSWWLEPPAPGASCTASDGQGTLRLFPLPAAEADDAPAPHFLIIAGVTWRRLPLFALDPDDWRPHLRRPLPGPIPDSAAPAAGRQIAIRPSSEQRQALLAGRPLDLCRIAGLGELCARNARARRQLYTALPGPDAEPWPEEHLLRTQAACRAALGDAAEPDACAEHEHWQRQIAGALHVGFRGEALVTERPAIRETWGDGAFEWRLDAGSESRQALAEADLLELELLDGERVGINPRELLEAPARPLAPWQRWLLGAAALATLAALAFWALARRDARRQDDLEKLVESAVERRLRTLGAPADSVVEDRELDRRLSEAIEGRLRDTSGELERQAAAQEERLAGVAGELAEQLRLRSDALAEELRGSLLHEAQSLSEGLRQDVEAGASPFQALCRELDELPAGEREPLTAALAALARLGDWIDRLWPVLQTVAGRDPESLPQGLSEAAANEWRRAVRTLDRFRRSDAVMFRCLGNGSTGPSRPSPDPPETAHLDSADLLAPGRPLAERLKRYLEPFDHIGRLGEVTLALQYLVEAFPIEQLSRDERSRFRQQLAEALRSAGLEEDFHRLIARSAAGIGLRYRPVRYYKSRTDQSEHAFVRQQVSPISLSERVGFDATADKATIMRLERPFFHQLDTGIYYAGHAHVAR